MIQRTLQKLRFVIFCTCSVLAIFAAAPTYAAVCTPFEKPLTLEQIRSYAAEAKDVYPAKYRPLLDSVAVQESPQNDLDIYVTKSSSENTLLIPPGILKKQCLLMFGVIIYSTSKSAQEFIKSTANSDSWPKNQSRIDVVLEFLDFMTSLNESKNLDFEQKFGSMLRVMAEQSITFAIAHEYGHVIIDDRNSGQDLPQDFDSELEADLEALYIFGSFKSLPYSDSFLFGGRALLDSVRDPKAHTSVSPHEPVACRAARSNLMREQIVPLLLSIRTSTKSAILGEKAENSNISLQTIEHPGTSTDCSRNLPRTIKTIESDLLMVDNFLKKLSNKENINQDEWQNFESMKLKSRFGRTLKTTIQAAARVIPNTSNAQQSFEAMRAMSEAGRQKILKDLDSIANDPKTLEIPSAEYRDLLSRRAMAQFYSAPVGASFRQTFQELESQLTLADYYGSPTFDSTGIHSLAAFMTGQCGKGYVFLRQFNDLQDRFESRTAGDLGKFVSPAPNLPNPLLPLLTAMKRSQTDDTGELTGLCLEFQKSMTAGFIGLYGFVE